MLLTTIILNLNDYSEKTLAYALQAFRNEYSHIDYACMCLDILFGWEYNMGKKENLIKSHLGKTKLGENNLL